MGKAELLFAATATLFLCLCRAGVIKDGAELQGNLVMCPDPGDPSNKMQIDTEVTEPAHWGVIEKTFSYPPAGFFPKPISCILVQDLSTDGKGGIASIPDGGLDARRITIKLRSQAGHGLHYKIQIYTK